MSDDTHPTIRERIDYVLREAGVEPTDQLRLNLLETISAWRLAQAGERVSDRVGDILRGRK